MSWTIAPNRGDAEPGRRQADCVGVSSHERLSAAGLPFRQGLWRFPKRMLVGRFLDIHIGQQIIVC
jgi:hypothetical protein